MASSLDIFRRNQKMVMAVLCVVLIFGWLIGDAIFKVFGISGGSRGSGGETVATWKYGTVTETDMQRMRVRDARLKQFIYQECPRQMNSRIAFNFPPASEDELLLRMVLNKKGEQLGIQITDDEVRNYLQRQTARAMLQAMGSSQMNFDQIIPTITQMKGALSQMGMSQGELFSMARPTLLAERVHALYVTGLGADALLPDDRFREYTKIGQQYTIEAVALRVKDFLDRVDDKPMTDAELKKLYDAHKNDFAHDGQPGFREPYKAAFQFYRADYTQFLAQVEPDVSEKDIADFYDKHKDDFIEKEEKKEPEFKDGAKKDPDKKDTETKDAEKKDPEKKDAPPTKDGEKPVGDKAVPPATTPTPPPAKAPPATPPVKTPAATPKTNSGSDASPRTSAIPVMFQADKDKSAKPDEKAPPALDAPKLDAPKTDPPTDLPADPKDDPKKDDWVKPEPKYKSFESVKDDIRKRLAAPKARKKMSEALSSLTEKVTDYGKLRQLWRIAKATKPNTPAPPAPNFSQLGKPLGLTVNQTPLLAQQTFITWPELGGLMIVTNSPLDTPQSYINFAYNQHPPEYEPMLTHFGTGSMYLIWRIDEKEEYTPTFDQVKEDVIAAWKNEAASKLARTEAQRLLDIVKKNPTLPMFESLGKEQGYTVIKVGPFAWKVRVGGITAREAYSTSNLDAIPDAGDEFMKGVYALSDGEAGLAWNQPRSAVYAVKVVQTSKTLNDLVRDFLHEATQYDFSDYSQENDIIRKWRQSLLDEMQLKVVKPSRAVATSNPSDAEY